MSAKLVVLYHQPTDRSEFDRYYAEVHTPLAKRQPGLRAFTINNGPITTPAGDSPYYVAAELMFDTLADLQAASASPEGQAAAADLANFAHTGITVLIYETRDA